MTRHRPLAPVLVLAAPLALAGCAGFSLDEGASPRSATTTTGSRPVEAAPPARPATKSGGELHALRPSPRPSPAPDVGGGPSPGTGTASPSLPPKLIGLSEDETVALLGRPAEETAQPPGKLFLYRANGCRLSVHLFPDMEKGGFYTLDYAADGNRDTCLGKVAGEARKRGGALADPAAKPG